MKKIGLVGGLGWVSTLEYYRQINKLSRAHRGGHYSANIVVESLDEGDFLEKMKTDPTEIKCQQMIVDAVGRLTLSGAEVIALCANGLHRFLGAIRSAHRIDMVDIRQATAKEVSGEGFNEVGLIGVRATMEGGFYKEVLVSNGIRPVIPSDNDRSYIHNKIVNELVLDYFKDSTRIEFIRTINELNVGAVILACTEIPLLLKQYDCSGVKVFSTTDIHCRAIVEKALMS